MSITKNIKIQKNKILTYSVNKAGFKTVYGSEVVSENKTINVNMINLDNASEPFQLGDRLFGISSFVDYFTPSGEYDVDSLKYIKATQTTGTGLSNIQVVKGTSNTVGETGTWLSKVEKDLQIVTAKGTSKTFVFTYNGATWDITGDLTLSGQDTEDYGISFDGTAESGDVITVIETQYNKFAFFVLDANYRGNYAWRSADTGITDMPKQYISNPQDCLESATYYNQYIFNNANLNDYPAFNFCKNLGNFILPNGIKINALLPNGKELQLIYNNSRNADTGLDSFDPIIQGGSTSYNLTNWNFSRNEIYSSIEYIQDCSWFLSNNNVWGTGQGYSGKNGIRGVAPIFEVPVM